MVRSLTPNRRRQNIEFFKVDLKRFGIKFGQFPGCHPCAFRAQFHLVFAGIRIRSEMADIRNINDMVHVIAVRSKHAHQYVLEQIRPEVADMSKVVDRWPAGIDAHLIANQGFKGPNFSFIRVK